ncbi:hypothetical protein EMIHUDRAFT_369453 [Emiliania huxleyi CCMP1516]|uniref:Uncharacterized protein n=2 Tax=Emiliania huxleyi TaxID=2903 RepID=A0A0D3J820_EMIH1|nr:hypothetical protein EMIHUDRAFT_369453 [Emiliania huxleyi CCMP1516]EOD19655.1 hypothetical protein EMIHUDRAFT_369453 [Emiliania huxleyi CCMP1516]|eukprot:XP_005772084.1 hypothetical protein EMIHUDRAFT_369453 [Emiliania huxleyi CCMP1516]
MTRGARGGTTGIALARARASPWPLAARAAFFLARIHRSGGRRCENCGRATPPRAYDRAPGGARAECRRETSARLRTPAHAAERQRHHPRRAPTKRARGSPLRRPTAETLAPTPPRPRPAGPAPISRRTTLLERPRPKNSAPRENRRTTDDDRLLSSGTPSWRLGRELARARGAFRSGQQETGAPHSDACRRVPRARLDASAEEKRSAPQQWDTELEARAGARAST